MSANIIFLKVLLWAWFYFYVFKTCPTACLPPSTKQCLIRANYLFMTIWFGVFLSQSPLVYKAQQRWQDYFYYSVINTGLLFCFYFVFIAAAVPSNQTVLSNQGTLGKQRGALLCLGFEGLRTALLAIWGSLWCCDPCWPRCPWPRAQVL